jgi:hypothetical protein
LLRECPLYARLCAIQFDKVAIPVPSACER